MRRRVDAQLYRWLGIIFYTDVSGNGRDHWRFYGFQWRIGRLYMDINWCGKRLTDEEYRGYTHSWEAMK